jgi:hypothetical protein
LWLTPFDRQPISGLLGIGSAAAANFLMHTYKHKLSHTFDAIQGYKADLEMYKAQKPIEELRLRLLADAGLEAHPTLVRPRKPSMLVLLPRPMLKRMLRDGIRMVEERKRAAMAARRAEAEAIWLQKQEVRQAGVRGGQGDRYQRRREVSKAAGEGRMGYTRKHTSHCINGGSWPLFLLKCVCHWLYLLTVTTSAATAVCRRSSSAGVPCLLARQAQAGRVVRHWKAAWWRERI